MGRDEAPSTYVGVGLDLLDGGVVKGPGVGTEVAEVERLLDAGGVTAREAAGVDVAHPRQMGLELADGSSRVEGDDELAGDDLGLPGRDDGGGSGVAQRQRRREDEGNVPESVHLGQWVLESNRKLL